MYRIEDSEIHRSRYCNIKTVIFIAISVLFSRVIMYGVYLLWKMHTGSSKSFFSVLSIFDGNWYKSIISGGYAVEPTGHIAHDAANWAFFPLYPMLVKGACAVTSGEAEVVGCVLSTGFFVIALCVGYRYITYTRKNAKQAWLFVVFMAFGFYSFYFSLLYTESLFLLLVISTLYCMRRKRYILMGIFGGLASATRNLGIMLVFAIAVQYTVDYMRVKDKSLKGYFISIFGNPRLVLGMALIPAGMFAYMAYLGKLTGDPMAFMHIQRAWGRTIQNPLLLFGNAFLFRPRRAFYYALWTLATLISMLILVKNKQWSELSVGLILIVIPMSTSMDSLPRYIMGCFIPMLAFSDWLACWPRWLVRLTFMGCFLLEIIMIILWYQERYYMA